MSNSEVPRHLAYTWYQVLSTYTVTLQLAKRYVNAHALVDLSVSVVLEPLGSNSESASQQKVEDACIVVSTPMVIERGVTAVLLHLLSKNIVICIWVHLINHRVFQKIDSADGPKWIFQQITSWTCDQFCSTLWLQNCVRCCGLV